MADVTEGDTMGKRTADVVMGMLSDVGSSTRVSASVGTETIAPPSESVAESAPPRSAPPGAPEPAPVSADPASPAAPAASTGAAVPARSGPAAEEAVIPRTLRLRKGTAGDLRAAWLLAKREDVLLTAQDFASDLVEEALRMRQRRQRAAKTA